MISPYQKQDAPAWQRRVILIISGLFGATLLLFAAWAIVLFIDNNKAEDCVNRGGTYDEESGECSVELGSPSP